MIIPPNIRDDYQQARAWKKPKTLGGKVAVRLAAAIQWAVAEALKLEHQIDVFVDCGLECTCGIDWLAEAERWLRDPVEDK